MEKAGRVLAFFVGIRLRRAIPRVSHEAWHRVGTGVMLRVCHNNHRSSQIPLLLGICSTFGLASLRPKDRKLTMSLDGEDVLGSYLQISY